LVLVASLGAGGSPALPAALPARLSARSAFVVIVDDDNGLLGGATRTGGTVMCATVGDVEVVVDIDAYVAWRPLPASANMTVRTAAVINLGSDDCDGVSIVL